MAELNQEEGQVSGNPYVGPRTFQPGEILFGRDREERDLTSLIISHRLVLFYAPSGAGKSSLINTKITPNLVEQGFEVLPVVRVGGQSYPDDAQNVFIYNLIADLHQEKDLPAKFSSLTLSEFLDDLVQIDGEFVFDEEYAYALDEAIKPRVLIIDQFEEILTTNVAHADHRDDFFQELSEALTIDPSLWIVLAMRDDFIAGLDPYLHYMPEHLRHRFSMQRLNRNAALEAVTKPAEAGGRCFEEDAAEMLVDNLRLIKGSDGSSKKEYLDYVEPVQLQAVCFQMWEKLKDQAGDTITCDDVEQYADVDMALTSFYEETVAATVANVDVTEIKLRNWFEKWFITEAGTRNMVFRGLVLTGNLPTPVADFVRGRFILRSVERQEGIWYELVHDRLVGPIKSANRNWRLDQPLLGLAQQWEDDGHSPESLLDGRSLDRFLETNWEGLGSLVVAFVEASMEVRRQEEKLEAAAQEADRQLKLEQQRALAASEKARADEAVKAKIRQRRLGAVVIALLVIGAIVTSFLAYEAIGNAKLASENEAEAIKQADLAGENEAEAKKQAALALENAELAKANEQDAVRNAAIAIAAANLAKENLSLFEVQSLIDETSSLRVGTHTNDELALLVGIEALRLSETLSTTQTSLASRANSALRNALQTELYSTVLNQEDILINGLAVSPDGRTLASAGTGGVIRLFDLSDPRSEPRSLPIDLDEATAVAFSPDGSQLAASGFGQLWLWDMDDLDAGPAVHFGRSGSNVNALAFSPDGETLASGDDDFSITIWPVSNMDNPIFLEADGAVTAVTFSPDGQTLATGDDIGQVRFWDMTQESPQEVKLRQHGFKDGTAVYALAFSADGLTLASGGSDALICLWEEDDLSSKCQDLSGHQGAVKSLAFSPDGKTLASGAEDNNVHLWDYSNRQAAALKLIAHGRPVTSVAYLPDGSKLVSGGLDGMIRQWELTNAGQEPRILSGHQGAIQSIALSGDRSTLAQLASAGDDGTIRLWDPANPTETPLIMIRDLPVSKIAFSEGGDKLAAGTNDGRLLLWDPQTPESEPEIVDDANNGLIRSIVFSPDGNTLVSARDDGAIILRDTFDIAAELQPENFLVDIGGDVTYALAISADGSILAAAGDEEIRLFDLSNPDSNVRILTGNNDVNHDGPINSVAFSADGSQLASGGQDSKVILWDLSSYGSEPHLLSGHKNWISAVEFSPNSPLLASASGDKTIRIWDLSNLNKQPQILDGHEDAVLDLAFSKDGSTLTSSSSDSTIRLWLITDKQLSAFACTKLGRNLSWQEAQDQLSTELYHVTCPTLPIHPTVAMGLSENENDERFWNMEALLAKLWGESPMAAHNLTQQLPSAFISQAQVLGSQGRHDDALALINEAQQLNEQVDLTNIGEAMAEGWRSTAVEEHTDLINEFANELRTAYPQIADEFEQQIPFVLIEQAVDQVSMGDAETDMEALSLVSDARKLDPEVDLTNIGLDFADQWQIRDWEVADRLQNIESFAEILNDLSPTEAALFRQAMSEFLIQKAIETAQSGQNQLSIALVADAHALDFEADTLEVAFALANSNWADWVEDPNSERIETFTSEIEEKAPILVSPFRKEIALLLINEAVLLLFDGQNENAFNRVRQAQDINPEINVTAVGSALAGSWDEFEDPERWANVQTFAAELSEEFPKIADEFLLQMPQRFVNHAESLIYIGENDLAFDLAVEAVRLDAGVSSTALGSAFAVTWDQWDGNNRIGSVESFAADLAVDLPDAAEQFLFEIPFAFINRAAEEAENSNSATALALMAEARALDPEIDLSDLGFAFAFGLDAVDSASLKVQVEAVDNELSSTFPEAVESFREAVPGIYAENANDLALEGDFDEALALLSAAREQFPSFEFSWVGSSFAQGWRDWDAGTLTAEATDFYYQLAEIDESSAEQFKAAFSWSLIDRAFVLAEEEADQDVLALSEAVIQFDRLLWTNAERALINMATSLVENGYVELGLAIFADLEASAPDLAVSASTYNQLCWFGALWGFPEEVLFACNKAAKLDPENGDYIDSRGLALAMLGDYESAIEDFEFFIAFATELGFPIEIIEQREQWIEALREDIDPFDEETLRFLLGGF